MSETESDKNISPGLSSLEELAAHFAHPPKEFSPVPIWWWSGARLEPERLRWQLEQFARGGVYNLIVLNLAPTGPLYGADPDDPPFLSEAWWQIFEAVCEDARELGVRIWFYDQLGFSGANLQAEVVRDEPAFAGQWLECVVEESTGPLEVHCPTGGIPLAAATIPLDADGQPLGEPVVLPLDGRRVRAEGSHRQRVRLVYAVQRGFDYFNPAACSRLLDRVHGAFERRMKRFLGDVIVGSFQDELPSLPTWGPDFAARFRERKGYDLLPHLPALWEDNATARQVRVDVHQMRAELAEEAFFRPLFDWHVRHGLICGFDQQGPARAGHPLAAVQYYANYLQTHRWFTAPGSDHHGEAKIHSSLAHLYGRPRVWIEAFHSSGWGGTLEETFDWLLPWLRAGATLYDPHAVYYSTRGGWWEWAPPSTCWRQPYWRHYHLFAHTVSRLCFLLSQGRHVCDIGILYPTTSVQAALPPTGEAFESAQAAHAAYLALVGSMFWQKMQPGVLDRDRRDFDVLDDASLQRAEVAAGALRIGAESYQVVVLPACQVLEEATAAVLCRFVEQGGRLVAIGALPCQAADADSTAVAALQALFEAGRAHFVEQPADLPALLADLPRRVEAPVPALHRQIDGRDILFLPAAFPHATRHLKQENWLDVEYTFNPEDHLRSMPVTVRGVQGAPQLWDPLTGERWALRASPTDEGVTLEVPFAGSPAAVVVWPRADEREPALPADSSEQSQKIIALPGPWESQIEPTLENRFGDFTRPAYPGAPPVQTWRFQHRVEQPGEDGRLAGWYRPAADDAWQVVSATFGTYGWWLGPLPADRLPPPLSGLSDGADPLAVSGWQPAVYSLSRGIQKDPLHRATLGPKGHVPEEFLSFGPVEPGEGVQFRTTVWMSAAGEYHLALGAPAAKQVWVNGRSVGTESPGYLWMVPARLEVGYNLLEFQLIAEERLNLRAYWALIRDPERFSRPEWITHTDAPQKHSWLRFAHTLHIPFPPTEATIQVGADGPCRILVNQQEVGRQGGFDPYYSTVRVQPYPVQTLQQGENQLVLEVQDLGRPAAVVVDGLVHGPAGQVLSWTSGPQWQVQRDDGLSQPVKLRRRQWSSPAIESLLGIPINMDPAYTHLWRRPHPLPAATWLEDRPADETVVSLVPDAIAGHGRVEWFRWTVPPGATEITLPVQGDVQVWIDGETVSLHEGKVILPADGAACRTAVARVVPARGHTGGGVWQGPVTYALGAGQIEPGWWAEQGLASYSGGVRYRTHFTLTGLPPRTILLDLGQVRGTAEVQVNGVAVGARVWSPYRFDITDGVRAGENILDIWVFNTLAPYLDGNSPTHYIFPGQVDSGLVGPVRLYC